MPLPPSSSVHIPPHTHCPLFPCSEKGPPAVSPPVPPSTSLPVDEGASGLCFPPAVSCGLPHHTFVKTSLSSPCNPEPKSHSFVCRFLGFLHLRSLLFIILCPPFTDTLPVPGSLASDLLFSSILLTRAPHFSQFSWQALCLLTNS